MSSASASARARGFSTDSVTIFNNASVSARIAITASASVSELG